MRSDQQFPLRNSVVPCDDQASSGYEHIAPIASIFDRTDLPQSANLSKPFHGVEFQPSVVCPRNFVIFDQTDNRSQVMFNPAIGSKFCYPGLNIGASYVQDTTSKGKDANKGGDMSSRKEDSDDIDALLSLDEEECDEEEVSTAGTYGNCGSDSSDSCSNYGSKPRKNTLPCLKKSSGSGTTSCSDSKRRKMRKMVKALRETVPGAKEMNSVAVLDEAVRYLKSLKVEVQKLGVGDSK